LNRSGLCPTQPSLLQDISIALVASTAIYSAVYLVSCPARKKSEEKSVW